LPCSGRKGCGKKESIGRGGVQKLFVLGGVERKWGGDDHNQIITPRQKKHRDKEVQKEKEN